MNRNNDMLSLFLRNLFFTILQPGVVAGLIPYLILRNKVDEPFTGPFHFYKGIGFLFSLIGLVIVFDCITRFAVQGKGTLSPADPTKKLVIKGLYRFSRNPMYIGVLMILIGETIFFQPNNLWIYTLFIFCMFYLFVLLVEEPRLHRDFGEEYEQYCRKVRRWF